VNFDGTTATPSTIRGSGNVSSVTRNATGNYTVNFTTAMPDVNYSIVSTNVVDLGTNRGGSSHGILGTASGNNLLGGSSIRTSSFDFGVVQSSSSGTSASAANADVVTISIFR